MSTLQYRTIILITTVVLFSTGCTMKKEASVVHPRHYQAHSVLYEVQYDTECSLQVELQKRIFTLRKDQRLLPKNFSNLKTDGSTFKGGVTLPEDAIGLFLGIVAPADWYYIVIKQDGSFVSSNHLMNSWKPNGMGNHTDILMGNVKDGQGCKIIDGKALFKAIRR